MHGTGGFLFAQFYAQIALYLAVLRRLLRIVFSVRYFLLELVKVYFFLFFNQINVDNTAANAILCSLPNH